MLPQKTIGSLYLKKIIMRKILILGAGLSASSLIKYLLDNSTEFDWKIRIGDLSKKTAEKKINGHPNGEAFEFDVTNETQTNTEVSKADIVVSMLPASMHFSVAQACVTHEVNMVTASLCLRKYKVLTNKPLIKVSSS